MVDEISREVEVVVHDEISRGRVVLGSGAGVRRFLGAVLCGCSIREEKKTPKKNSVF